MTVPCEIVVDKVTLGKALLPVLRFSPVGIILPLPHNHRAYHRRYLNLSKQLHRCSAHLTLTIPTAKHFLFLATVRPLHIKAQQLSRAQCREVTISQS